MKNVITLLAFAVTSVLSQEILEVTCGQDAIEARFNKQTADAANFARNDLHFNDPGCLFEREVDGYYVRRIEPLSSCGTEVLVNATHAKFVNSISTGAIETGLNFKHGIIVGQPKNEQLISATYECSYEIDLRLSAAFIANISIVRIPIPDAIETGSFKVAMAIYKDATYRELHTPEGAVPVLQPQETVFVGITMIDDTSENIFIRMKRCWATVNEAPESQPFYDLIVDSCAVPGAVTNSVTVTQNGVGHQALWQSKVFRFVGEEEEFLSVWLHCDVNICVEKSCKPECSSRRRKRRSSDFDGQQHILSYGPMVYGKKAEVRFEGVGGVSRITIVNETAARPEQVDEGIGDHTRLVIIGASAAFCTLCSMVALVVVLVRMKKSRETSGDGVTATSNVNKAFKHLDY